MTLLGPTDPPLALPETAAPEPPRGNREARPDRARTWVARRFAALLALLLATGVAGGVAVAAAEDGGPNGATGPGSTAGTWARPVPGEVLAPFDPPASDWSAGHRGVDLAAGVDAQVRAPAAGVVSFAGQVAGKPVVVVTHAGGLRSTFEPAVAVVPRGFPVARGAVVALVAGGAGPGGAFRGADATEGTATGGHCAAAGCLHWGVLRGQAYLDPMLLLGEGAPIVLLPAR